MDESALKILLDGLESSRSALDSWLFFWTLLVVVGVAMEVVFVVWEYVVELRRFRPGVNAPEKPSLPLLLLGLFGAGLVAFGVTGELDVGAKIGTVETKIRSANDLRAALLSKEAGDAKTSADGAAGAARRAREQSDKAVSSASGALIKAGAAEASLGKAEKEAKNAQAAASNALTMARDVRKEADSFKRDIQSANTELVRLRTPRLLTHTPGLVPSLKTFSGTEYTFSGLFQDSESGGLLRSIDAVLQEAGWKRVPSPHTFPSLTLSVTDNGPTIEVPASMVVGLVVSVDSPEPVESLQIEKPENLPAHIKAAIRLNGELIVNVFPPDESEIKRLEAAIGKSTVVRITVGRKP